MGDDSVGRDPGRLWEEVNYRTIEDSPPMPPESPRHKTIRENIIRLLEDTGLKPMSSHEDAPEVHFYHISESNEKVHLADPDILVQRGSRFLAIEIELSLAPKHLLGVAFVVSQCTHYKLGDGDILPLGKFDFLLVVPSSEIDKKGSHRPKQLRFVEEALQGLGGVGSAHVAGDDMVGERLKEWRDG